MSTLLELRATNTTDLDGPAISPPANVTPDFDNPGGSHALGYFVCLFCGILSTISVLIRLVSRWILKRLNIDDVFLVCGLVCKPLHGIRHVSMRLTLTQGLLAGYIWPLYEDAISPGVQVHEWNVRLRDLERLLWVSTVRSRRLLYSQTGLKSPLNLVQAIHIASINYGMSIMFVKLAILIDWLRIFVPRGQRNVMFWSIHILIWCNVIYYVSGTLLEIFRCSPRQKIWDPLFEGGSCPIDIAANNFASTLINLASDLAILILPQWVIWRLNTTRSKKLGVSLLFVIGILSVRVPTPKHFHGKSCIADYSGAQALPPQD